MLHGCGFAVTACFVVVCSSAQQSQEKILAVRSSKCCCMLTSDHETHVVLIDVVACAMAERSAHCARRTAWVFNNWLSRIMGHARRILAGTLGLL